MTISFVSDLIEYTIIVMNNRENVANATYDADSLKSSKRYKNMTVAKRGKKKPATRFTLI